jgi:AhpD family alkylhydroperoxidase
MQQSAEAQTWRTKRRITTMANFTVHTIETAPAAAKGTLEAVQKAWGFVPTLHGMLAESPAAVKAYDTVFGIVGETSLTPAEQQVVFLATSVFHECEYCVAGHTYLGRMVKLDESAIQALRNGTIIADAKLQALRVYVEAVIRERGFVSDAATDAFIAAGYTRANVMDILVVVAAKTISNYANHIAHTPKESFMADPALGWIAPRNRLIAAE